MNNKGILPINKLSGWTSFDVCNKIKHMVKPLKVGHLGTLDPMATGVLLVTIGKATKLFDIMQEKEKTYIAEFEFGKETDTLDIQGQVLSTTDNIPTCQEIKNILPNYIGEIEQIPPKYSAKNVNGKRAYELARENKDFELKPKTVKVYDINFISYINNVLKLKITCGSGTYIRSIGRDLAHDLNSLATMISLERTNVGQFSVESCLDARNLTPENIKSFVIDVDSVLDYNKLYLDELLTAKILNGQKINLDKPDGNYHLIQNNEVVAIVNIAQNLAKMSIFLG